LIVIDYKFIRSGISVLRPIICIFFFALNLAAQNDIDSVYSLQSPLQQDTSIGALFLQVQRPDKDTILSYSSRYRIAACTRPDAQAFINNRQVKVYESGAFVGLADIKTGANTLRFMVRSASGDSLWKEFVITRPEPMKNSSHDTLVIEKAFMEPSQDVWLTSGDVLDVKFKGSPGWEASFDIPDVESGIQMRELTPKEGGGFAGIYSGRYKVKPGDEVHEAQIKFKLKKSFWSSEKVYTTAKVSFLPKELPRVAEVTGQRPYLNDRLGGSKLGFLQPGVLVEIVGKVGSQYRIRLSESMEAWLPEEFAKLLPPNTPQPRSLAGAISATGNGSEDVVTLALSEKLPYSSDQLINPNAIVVDVYGATSNTNWISLQPSSRGIENITWKQVAGDQYRMTVSLRHRQHWGYDIDYIGNSLRVKIRRPPVSASRDSILSGLTIAVDAGHGGENKGSIGATGALEKDLSISIAYILDSILVSKKAKVVLTRTEDEVPAMNERISRILNSGAQILVSIHCNSASDNADPVQIQGTSAYYRYIGFKTLADIIYEKMFSLGLKQFGVIGSFNFTLNSLTQMPNVLVETAFLSNPEDEILLLKDKFRKDIAQQIAAGLEDYVNKYGEKNEK
jgi:N-acetylmuramoyl-L-alanine amidase